MICAKRQRLMTNPFFFPFSFFFLFLFFFCFSFSFFGVSHHVVLFLGVPADDGLWRVVRPLDRARRRPVRLAVAGMIAAVRLVVGDVRHAALPACHWAKDLLAHVQRRLHQPQPAGSLWLLGHSLARPLRRLWRERLAGGPLGDPGLLKEREQRRPSGLWDHRGTAHGPILTVPHRRPVPFSGGEKEE